MQESFLAMYIPNVILHYDCTILPTFLPAFFQTHQSQLLEVTIMVLCMFHQS